MEAILAHIEQCLPEFAGEARRVLQARGPEGLQQAAQLRIAMFQELDRQLSQLPPGVRQRAASWPPEPRQPPNM